MSGQLTLTAPINRVQVDVCVDRSFDDVTLDCVASGGRWVNGTVQTAAQFNAKPIPDGVQAADVQGVRYTFTRGDGAFWENPATPTQSVSISVQRRLELRSGGEVPSTLAGNTAAPGEEAPGQFTNRVVADVTGALNSGGTSDPLTATDDAEAIVKYTHSTNSVAVQKTPTGVQSPGKTFTYGLSVTNTGNTPIMNPVITDVLPRDAGGPQLIFDPTTELTSSPYSYSITGAAPIVPNGTQLPTAVADVTATVNSSADKISFTFPKGSVLEVGQTYKVSIQLMFRPGLIANLQVTNSFGVTGDRAWDACTGVTGGRPGKLDAATGECRTDTIVSVLLAGAIRPVKTVKAVDPELGNKSVGGPNICAADEDGFWRGGCVPVTKPGKDEIWRMAFTNTGTLGMNRLVAIDKLPAVGDTGSSTSLPRGSQFATTFQGTAVLAGAPQGSTLTTYYTTDAQPCTTDLDTTGPGCAPGRWNVWDPKGTVDPKTVLGLKFVVDFATPLQPAGVVKIDLTTTSPAVSPTAGPDTVAWNTVAVAGRTVNGNTVGKTPVVEGNKVGVILATGPLQVVKALEGDGVERYAPASFTAAVTCVSAGVELPPVTVTLNADGTPVTVPDLPWGSECTVAEDDNGQTSADANTVTIVSGTQDVPVITLTNTYSLAGLTLSKAVTSTAVDADGTPISYGPFGFGVSCTFLGAAVYADGYSAEKPMDLTIADGDSVTLTGLPARAECVVTETDTKGAVSTTVATVTGENSTEAVAGTTATIGLAANGDEGDVTNATTFGNVFADGSVQITKEVMGDGAAAYGQGPFTVHATCTLVDPTGTRTVWDGDLVLGGDEPLVATIDHIASGATCEITETRNGGADWTTVSEDTVTVTDGGTAEVTIRNGFQLGALHVEKEIVGDGAALYGAGPFEVLLSCVRDIDGEQVAFDVPGGATRALTAENGYQADYEGLPARALCNVSESLTGGATSSTVTAVHTPLPETFAPLAAEAPVSGDAVEGIDLTVGVGATVTISLVNTFDVGAILVTKEITGAGAADNADKVFTVVLTCSADVDGESVQVAIPDGAERTLSKATGLTTRYEQLPIGADCSLAETNNGGAVRTTITPNTGDRHVGQVTVLPAPVDVPGDGGEGGEGAVDGGEHVERVAAGDVVADESSDVEFVDGAVLITVVNEFGPTPIPPRGGLTSTGVDAMLPWALGGGLAALGTLLLGLGLWHRRRTA
ncbi:DUF5979 domain-containing protein [Plantibacter sp. Mn2098]|uniref:DUF5979 domain-containing protein n=1 Tax=Plantibacter sp. Mn2098 TaxID=3395266 RepID=UPI003BC76D94